MGQQDKKHVLVTGGDGALGRAVVARYEQAGHRVSITAWPAPGGAAEPTAARTVVNLADPAQVRSKLADVAADIVVHCAGGFRYAHVDAITDADFDFLLDANFKATFYLLRQLLPTMKQRGFGRVVVIGANAVAQPSPGMGPYAACKAAVHALVQSAALEVRDFDININAVCPSILDTPANRRDMPKADFSKWVGLEALAQIIFELTGERSRPINGALIPVVGRSG